MSTSSLLSATAPAVNTYLGNPDEITAESFERFARDLEAEIDAERAAPERRRRKTKVQPRPSNPVPALWINHHDEAAAAAAAEARRKAEAERQAEAERRKPKPEKVPAAVGKYKPYAALEADPTSLYLLDRLPAGRWQGRLLAEAGRLAKADVNGMIRAAGRWPTSADLRAALEPPPSAPEPSGRRWQAAGIVNDRGGQASGKLARWADAEAGEFADLVAEWRQQMDEWSRWQPWASVAREAARLTTAIREYVGDTPHLRMIGYDYNDVCKQAEADANLAQRVLASMRGMTPGNAEDIPTEEDLTYVFGWGLDLAASLAQPDHAEINGWSIVQQDDDGRWRHPGRPHYRFDGDVSLVIRCRDGRWRHEADHSDIDMDAEAAFADRLTDRRWHRRRLNRAVGRTCEHVALVLRLVGAHGAERCCTDVALERRRSQIRRQIEWALAMEAAAPHEGGQRVLMAALMAASRKGQLASMWCIIQGMAEHAREQGLIPMWITLTSPPKFHAAPKKGEDGWDPKLTPADAKAWMQAEWARVRAWFAEEDVEPLGVWVAEPNEDACYHRHILLWVKPEQRAGLEATIRRYWPTTAAAKIERKADDATNSVARYIWAYLRPALMHTGHGWTDDGSDDPQAEHRASDEIVGRKGETAERYDTHASTWGYRRYGFFGLAKGTRTAWNKVFRWPPGEDMALPEGPFAEAKRAMDRQDWKATLDALGAFGERRFEFAYQERMNRYGESEKICRGVSDGFVSIRMSCGWTIEPAAEGNVDKDEDECFVDDDGYADGLPDVFMESELAFTVIENFPRGAADAARGDPPGGAGNRLREHLMARFAAAGPQNLRF